MDLSRYSSNPISIRKFIRDSISMGAHYIINHSGGKDSQALYLFLRSIIPQESISIVHATLGNLEWPGTIDHIKNTTTHPLHVVSHGTKLLDYVVKRGKWFSPSQRFCTSMQKTAPIDKWTRAYSKEYDKKLLINCLGIRAEESSNRAKKEVYRKNERLSKAGRTVIDFLPIHDWVVSDVYGYIKKYNQKPHWAYLKGMSRLSCSLCIMSSKNDILIASKLRPEIIDLYSDIEKKIEHSFFMPKRNQRPYYLKEYIASLERSLLTEKKEVANV